MYYNNDFFGPEFNASPNLMPQQQPQQAQQQQQQQGIDPMQALNMYNQFSGGGGLLGGGSAAAGGGTVGAGGGLSAGAGAGSGISAGAGGATGGAAAAGGEGAMTAMAASPIGWIAAAALGQQVMHNKGISSWQDALKGQGGRNIGDHFINQWGMEDTLGEDVLGVMGWGEGGGILNPGNLMAKIF